VVNNAPRRKSIDLPILWIHQLRGSEMKQSSLRRTLIILILAVVILPASYAHCGLHGPPPPAPPAIPTPPPDSEFDYVKVDDAGGQAGVVNQIETGTEGKDKIIQYGGMDNVLQGINAGSGNDWLLQVGGDQATSQVARGGSGNNTIYQYGGRGESNMAAISPNDNNTIIQVGGQGSNQMNITGGGGVDYIEQYGGSGNNLMHVAPNEGDDVIKLYGGPGNNSMTYDVGSGNDLATILGGGGYNNLTINKNQQNFTLQDYQGKVLFQSGTGGTTITVANLQRIIVIGDAGKPIYTYNARSVVPMSIAPLLLGN
jgi:Ca2+-binding RTX toxin-like protein